MVYTLLSEGAKVDLQREDGGATPLHEASRGGHTAVVRALLSWGAKVDLQTTKGLTSLCVACDHGHTEVSSLWWSQGQPVGQWWLFTLAYSMQ